MKIASHFGCNIPVCHKCAKKLDGTTGDTCPHDPQGLSLVHHAEIDDCPLNKFPPPTNDCITVQERTYVESEFRKLWRRIHRRAVEYSDPASELIELQKLIGEVPCGQCRNGAIEYLQQHPPDFTSPRAYFEWGTRWHDSVTEKKTGKAIKMAPVHAARIHGCTRLFSAEELAADMEPVRLLIKIDLSLGDSICLTGAIHDLHNSFPGEYEVFVETPFPQVFENLPVTCATPPTFDAVCSIHNGYKWGENFSQFYNRQLSEAINRPIAQGPFRPWLLLSDEEYEAPPIVRGPYWAIFPGGKWDCLTKCWPGDSWNRLANVAPVRFVAVGGVGPDHIRPRLNDKIIDLIGQTTVRELIRLVASANCCGVVCGITAGVHLADAFGKPCVVIAGARERPAPARYDGHQYLETPMPCAGCWSLRVLPFAESFNAYS